MTLTLGELVPCQMFKGMLGWFHTSVETKAANTVIHTVYIYNIIYIYIYIAIYILLYIYTRIYNKNGALKMTDLWPTVVANGSMGPTMKPGIFTS